MASERLTEKRVAALVADLKRDVWLWDATVIGLAVRVRPSGSASYLVQYRARGRQRRLTLGKTNALKLDRARSLAREALGAVASGRDPAGEKQEAAARGTVAQFCARFMAEHGSRQRPATQALYRAIIDNHIVPALGSLRLDSVTRGDVVTMHRAIGARGAETYANKAVNLLANVYARAVDWAVLPETHINPARRVKLYVEKPRERLLTLEEYGKLGEALDYFEAEETMSRSAIGFFRMLAFTGARATEMRLARWADLDASRAILRLVHGKGRERDLHLNEQALEVLSGLPRTSEYIFPSPTGRGALGCYAHPWQRLCDRAELRDARVHDLRHGYASHSVIGGASLVVTGGLLGHKRAATTSRYAHLSADPLKVQAEVTGSTLGAAMKARPAAVIPLREADAG